VEEVGHSRGLGFGPGCSEGGPTWPTTWGDFLHSFRTFKQWKWASGEGRAREWLKVIGRGRAGGLRTKDAGHGPRTGK